MQTFLPSKSFATSANMLDSKRLNKQVLEGYQILKVLSSDDPFAGWRNHPAVKMWRGHEMILHSYVLSMVEEAKARGIKTDKNEENISNLTEANESWWGREFPQWYQNSAIMRLVTTTHRANLYKKDPSFYGHFKSSFYSKDNMPCCDGCKYFWVTHKLEGR
jgi:hypothetical protein